MPTMRSDRATVSKASASVCTSSRSAVDRLSQPSIVKNATARVTPRGNCNQLDNWQPGQS